LKEHLSYKCLKIKNILQIVYVGPINSLHTDKTVATLDPPAPVFLVVVVVGGETDDWVVATAECKVGVPVCLPARPATSAEADTVETGTHEPPAPVLVSIVVVRQHTDHCLVVGATVCEISVHVVNPAGPLPSILACTDGGEQGSEDTILAAIVVP